MYKDCYEALLEAIIKDAISELSRVYRLKLKGGKLTHEDEKTLNRDEKFFRESPIVAYMLPDLDGDSMIKGIRKQAGGEV